MSRNAQRPSADELREMARNSSDPVIRDTLRQLAEDVDEEQANATTKRAAPPPVA